MECTSHKEEEESLFQKGLFVCVRAHTYTHMDMVNQEHQGRLQKMPNRFEPRET